MNHLLATHRPYCSDPAAAPGSGSLIRANSAQLGVSLEDQEEFSDSLNKLNAEDILQLESITNVIFNYSEPLLHRVESLSRLPLCCCAHLRLFRLFKFLKEELEAALSELVKKMMFYQQLFNTVPGSTKGNVLDALIETGLEGKSDTLTTGPTTTTRRASNGTTLTPVA